MVINTNLAALQASRFFSASSTGLARSLARLSSGSRITSPEDDAAGLAVSGKLSAEVHRHRAAMANLGNAVSFLQTQDGYLQKVQKAIDRMGELAMLALDVTKTDDDRANYEAEYEQLNNFVDDTFEKKFNGVSLFASEPILSEFRSASDPPAQDSLTIDTGLTSGTVQFNFQFDSANRARIFYPPGGDLIFDTDLVSGSGEGVAAFGPGASTSVEIVVDAGSGWRYVASVYSPVTNNVTSDGEGSTFELPTIFRESVSGSIADAPSAADALSTAKGAIQSVARDRAKIGAGLARLQSHLDELGTLAENLEAATSRIADVDVAQEATSFARNSIIVQSGIRMLDQANVLPQSVLRLLGV